MNSVCEYKDCKYIGKPFNKSKRSKKLWQVIHHVDGNHFNDDPKNLMTMHFSCHVAIHMTGIRNSRFGKHLSEEHKKKISESLKRGRQS